MTARVNGDRLHLAHEMRRPPIDQVNQPRVQRERRQRVWLQIALIVVGLGVGFLAGSTATILLLLVLGR